MLLNKSNSINGHKLQLLLQTYASPRGLCTAQLRFFPLGITCQRVEQRNFHFASGVNRLRPIFDPMFQANPGEARKSAL